MSRFFRVPFKNGLKMTGRQNSTAQSAVVAVLLIGAVTFAVYGLAGSGSPRESTPRSPGPLPVLVSPAEPVESVQRVREFTGEIRAARESELSFERSGRITSMHVDEGDTVSAGQVLAEVDVELVEANLESAEARLAQARAVLAELEAGPRTEVIESARSTLDSFEATVNRLQEDFSRAERLVAEKATSRERYDTAKFQLQAAVAQRDSARRQLDELLAGTRPEQVAAQNAVVRQQESAVRALKLDIEDGRLLSPYAGSIAERMTDEGTVVSSSGPVLRLVETGNLEAWFGLPPAAAKQLEIGDRAEVSVDGTVLRGTVTSRRPRLDPVTRTRNTILRLDPTEASMADVVPGQIARMFQPETVNAKGFRVRTSALTPGVRGLWTLLVAVERDDSHVVEKRDVEVLYTSGDESVVTGTLGSNDLVIIDGVHRVVTGQSVIPQTSGSRSKGHSDD